MSNRYNLYLTDTENYLEPDKSVDILPKSLHCLIHYLDSHIDDFPITFKNKRGIDTEVLKEGFQITSNQFWPAFKEIPNSDLKYIKITKSDEGEWYLIDSRRRKR